VSHRQFPAFILRHRVADFDTWLAGYDAAAELRQSAGIIGHAANRSLDDPSLITVYHQAETFDALHRFRADPQMQAGMQEAGVTSEPEVSFHTVGWARTYSTRSGEARCRSSGALPQPSAAHRDKSPAVPTARTGYLSQPPDSQV
jgi:hypothetical protein